MRNGSVHELYRLKALITLDQVSTSVVEKQKNVNEQSLLVGFCKLSLYANESFDEHAGIFFGNG